MNDIIIQTLNHIVTLETDEIAFLKRTSNKER